MMVRAWRVAAFLLGGLASAGPAHAQNLVTNGDFDAAQGLAGWSVGLMAQLVWSPTDWLGEAVSGSARLTHLAPCASVFLTQCVEVPQPLAASYELGAAVYLESPLTQAAAEVQVVARDGAGCGGATLLTFAQAGVNQQGSWVSILNTSILLPPDTRSVDLLLVVAKLPFLPSCTPPLPNVTARFDHVRFGPTGTTPATLQSLSIE